MKRYSFYFLCMIWSFMSFAQEITCLNKLLPYNRHSGLHHLGSDEWSQARDNLDPELVSLSLNYLTNSKLFCRPGEMIIKIHPVCSTILGDIPQSNTCFVYTNLGYFVVSKDNNKNINFIFNRDKRYSENL